MQVISTIISASLLIGSATAIFGGGVVNNGTMTYMTGLRTTIDPNSEENYSFCGGVLISPVHVLTTATCTTSRKVKFVTVGAHYINGGNDGDEITVIRVTNHPNFKADTFQNDFAVLKLAKASKYNPVKLPASNGSAFSSGNWATAMGWGLTSSSPDAFGSEVLLRVSQQVIPNEDCRQKLNMKSIDMSLVCARGNNRASPCQGDTGGPLIRANSDRKGNDVLIGLIIGGPCGANGSPAIYGRVSSVLGWITSVMKA